MNSKTIEFFKEIAKIPRESGAELQIAKYLCEFAVKRNLEYCCDDFNNVVIKKKNADKEPIILQAHTDMVCEKEKDLEFDFSKDEIQIKSDGKYLKSKGTTLGADNGIGIAQILNILDSNIPCNVEAVFTVAEETDMAGAMNFDVSKLKGKWLISLDGFEENTIITESACFYDIILSKKYRFHSINENVFLINLSGLLGGHSGLDIDLNRGNANILLANLLREIGNVSICDFTGGTKFNVIPSDAKCEFASKRALSELEEICIDFENNWKSEFKQLNISIEHVHKNKYLYNALSEEDSISFLNTLLNFKHGVVYYNKAKEVTTSVNLGAVDLKSGCMKVGMRSSKQKEEKLILKQLKEYSKENNLDFKIFSAQPSFESSPESKLIKMLINTSPIGLFGTKTGLKSVHFAVELGLFKEKMPWLDIAIISPNIQNAHTVNECVEIESIYRTDKWLCNFLNELT